MVPYQIWLFCGFFKNVHQISVPSLRHSRSFIMYQFLDRLDDLGVRLLKMWRLNAREIHTDRDNIYTAENFDLKSHFISWMVDSLLPFFYLSVLWFRVFESFRFLSSINFLRSSLSTWFFATWWNLSFSVWFRIYYSGYSSGSWSIRQLGTFLVNLMFR